MSDKNLNNELEPRSLLNESFAYHIFDEPREHDHNFIQPTNIETLQGGQGVCFSVLIQKANRLHPMGHNP
jgi:hypothetical protein